MNRLIALLALLWPAAVMAAAPQPFERGSWSTLLEMHRGRATIVHFWGITCGPCLVELPQWTTFKANHPDVDLVMIEAEPLPDASTDLAAPLVKAGLDRVESWGFADSFIERLEYEVDPNWHGELPFTVLITPSGSATSILGPADFGSMLLWLDRHSDS